MDLDLGPSKELQYNKSMKTSIATSIKYGNYKQYLNKARRYAAAVERNWALVCEAIGLDKDIDVEVHFRPIKGYARGQYYSEKKRITIDPREFSFTDCMFETLAHEAEHCKQFTTGQMSMKLNKTGRSWLTVWEGKEYKQPSSHNAYLKRPWEVAAREAGRIGRTAYINRMKAGLKNKKNIDILPKK